MAVEAAGRLQLKIRGAFAEGMLRLSTSLSATRVSDADLTTPYTDALSPMSNHTDTSPSLTASFTSLAPATSVHYRSRTFPTTEVTNDSSSTLPDSTRSSAAPAGSSLNPRDFSGSEIVLAEVREVSSFLPLTLLTALGGQPPHLPFLPAAAPSPAEAAEHISRLWRLASKPLASYNSVMAQSPRRPFHGAVNFQSGPRGEAGRAAARPHRGDAKTCMPWTAEEDGKSKGPQTTAGNDPIAEGQGQKNYRRFNWESVTIQKQQERSRRCTREEPHVKKKIGAGYPMEKPSKQNKMQSGTDWFETKKEEITEELNEGTDVVKADPSPPVPPLVTVGHDGNILSLLHLVATALMAPPCECVTSIALHLQLLGTPPTKLVAVPHNDCPCL
eukprot:GHVT01078351.1.p1 GENE.GHVT01078351.1~~GHVT01078351.1.p1  ORF type:complete len:387 (+),score=45.47 GHVT01078351.1:911-2071(+)